MNINVYLYAIKYKLHKILEASLEKDKEALKNGIVKLTNPQYATIKVVEYTRSAYNKADQAILDKYAEENGIVKETKTYKRVEIDNIDPKVDNIVSGIITTLEDSDNKIAKRVATKIATKK